LYDVDPLNFSFKLTNQLV